jgi:hypothetical protein
MNQRKEPSTGNETRWFPWHIRPAYIGVYQRQMYSPGRMWMFSKWDGVAWHTQYPDIESAESATERSTYQRLPWRGLARPAPLRDDDPVHPQE